MAIDPPYTANTTPNPFDIYTDAGVRPQPTVPSLPRGNCNFVDLTPGANGTTCGCRRFWPRPNLGSPVVNQTGWCMCAHHACYHDQGPHDRRQQPGQQNLVAPTGQENERHCITGCEPLTPLVDVPMQNAEATWPALDFTAFSPGVPLSFVHDLPGMTGESIKFDTHSPPSESMPDTLAWDDYLEPPAGPCRQFRQQPESGAMPGSLSQQLILSQTTSITSSAQANNTRPFGGVGLDTLSRKATAQDIPRSQDSLEGGKARSENKQTNKCRLDTPSVVSGLGGKDVEITQPGTATQTVSRTDAAHYQEHPRKTLRNLSDTICGHEERLDRLETVSFSAIGHEECLEKHDHMDLRVTELEQRLEGVEKTGGPNPQNIDVGDDDSATSVASTAASTASRFNPDEIMNHISNLQARVTHMQSFLPSQGYAWTVEVVFLPFPLNRLWQDMSQFGDDHTVSSDDWTQMPMTASSVTMRSQSPFGGDWAAADRAAEWLHPRACGDKSTQDRRLRSRGLIQTVSFCGPDAKSVHAAVHKAFEAEFRTMGIAARRDSSNPVVSKYLGLQEAWVPLRKIHKDSRLRFLSAAEMLTPVSWDVNFLHSVTMRAVQPRLFITHPDAYIQDYSAYEAGWTWQRIRDMDEVCPDVTESQEAREADAVEHCWLWNAQLDEAPKTLTVLNVRQSCERRSTSPLGPGPATSNRPSRSMSPFVVRGPRQMISGRRAPRPPHIRTASVPSVSAVRPMPASAGRRRIVFHGQSRQSSPVARGLSQSGVQKRLRRTRSPSFPRHTPRWTVSPSPIPLGLTERGITPLAYATPYSNVPLQELRPVRGGSMACSTADQLGVEYATDELFDIEVYDSRSDESYSDNENAGDDNDQQSVSSHAMGLTHIFVNMHRDSQDRQLPEDEAWPGIEDQAHASDGENRDPHHKSPDDQVSNASSQPSEYPATERAWPINPDGDTGFRIHEDRE